MWKLFIEIKPRNFPGSPVLKTLYFLCRGHGSIPGQGTKIPTCLVAQPKKVFFKCLMILMGSLISLLLSLCFKHKWGGILFLPMSSSHKETEIEFHANSWLTAHYVCADCMLSCIWLFAIPCAIAHHTPLSRGFPRQEYFSGFPFPTPEDFPT